MPLTRGRLVHEVPFVVGAIMCLKCRLVPACACKTLSSLPHDFLHRRFFPWTPPEGTSLRYRLNWGAGGKRIEQAPEFSLFVGDLSPEATDAELKQTFLNKFPSVLGAKVVTNAMTGSSKSFGFIRFSDERERDKALTVMNGVECCGRPMRVAPATKRSVVPGKYSAPVAF